MFYLFENGKTDRLNLQGGHFAALERPDVLLKDVEDFLAEFWPRH